MMTLTTRITLCILRQNDTLALMNHAERTYPRVRLQRLNNASCRSLGRKADPVNDQELYKQAQERVQQLRGFYLHAAIYVIVNFFLLLLNLLTSLSLLWFLWPLLGWGAGLAVHAFIVFGAGRTWGREWEEQKISQIMEQERSRNPSQPPPEQTGGGGFNDTTWTHY
jgi:2TM domain-containing protein